MFEIIHTVDQAAQFLGLHAKTVLRMIKDGRLRATRIGKAYRIADRDLRALAGGSMRGEGARASCVVEIPDIAVEQSSRITTALQAALMARGQGSPRLQASTIYDQEARQLKLVLIGGAADVAALLQFIDLYSGGSE